MTVQKEWFEKDIDYSVARVAKLLYTAIYCQISSEMLEDQLSRQAGCQCSLPDDQNAGEHTDNTPARTTGELALACILVVRLDALADSSIT